MRTVLFPGLAVVGVAVGGLLPPAPLGAQPVCREIGFGQAVQSRASSDNSGHALTAGDFDNDGFDDVAVAGRQFTIGFRVYWGSPDGVGPAFTTLEDGSRLFGEGGPIITADLNGDGVDDLLLRDANRRCQPLISLGASRVFRRGTEVRCGDAETMISADVNGDGFDDALGWALRDFAAIRIWLSDGRGGLNSPPTFSASAPFGLSVAADVADVDNDGIPDLLIAGGFAATFSYPLTLNRSLVVSRGDGTGAFEILNQGQGVRIGGFPRALAARDLNRDGHVDAIVVTEDRLEVYLGREGASFDPEPASVQETPFLGVGLTLGDFNGDRLLDAVLNPAIAGFGPRRYAVYRGDGQGGFELDQLISTERRQGGFNWPVVSGDFNGDGLTDLITVERSRLANGGGALAALLFPNSCPVRVSLESDGRIRGVENEERYRARIRNISATQTLASVGIRGVSNAFLDDREARLDSGVVCPPSVRCELGALAPSEERFADLRAALQPQPNDAGFPPDQEKVALFDWDGGSTSARTITRIERGVDLVLAVEQLTPPVVGTDVEFQVRISNQGSETATDVRLEGTQSFSGTRRLLCQAQLEEMAPGAEMQYTCVVELPLEGDPEELGVAFNVRSAEMDAYGQDNSFDLRTPTQFPGMQPRNQRFRAEDLREWSPDPGLNFENRTTSAGVLVSSTGSLRQSVPGLAPGQMYSLRASASADRLARARAALRALSVGGATLGEVGPLPLEAATVLQTLFTAPADGTLVIELHSEINEVAVVRGEYAGVRWGLVELRPADPKTVQVPRDYSSVQEAIDASSDGDTIRIAPGVYRELIDMGDRAIVLESVEGPARTILDGGGNGDGLTISSGAPMGTAVRGLTIRNSNVGVRVGGVTIVEDNWITDHVTGVAAGGSAVVRRNRIAFNGHALSAGGSAQVIENTITNNGGRDFGRIQIGGGELVFSRNIVTDNPGGAVFARGGGVIERNVFRNNGGGPVQIFDGAFLVEQNLIVAGPEPSFQPPGSALVVRDGQSTVRNNTIIGSISESLPLVFIEDGPSRFANNVMATDVDGPAIVCSNASPQADGPNLVSNSGETARDCGSAFDPPRVLTSDPLFVSPLIGDYRLNPGSPAIDAGVGLPAAETDLFGAPRVHDGDGDGAARIDLGAYEHGARRTPVRSRSSGGAAR